MPRATAMKALLILIFLLLALPALLVPSLLVPSFLAQEAAKPDTKTETQTRGEAMLERARHLSDIRAGNAPGFRLKATFSFVGKNLETLRGTYTEIWAGDSQWRRETEIGAVRRVEVGGVRRRWVLDSDKNIPGTAAALPDLLNIFPSRELTFDFESVTESTETSAGSECVVTRADSQQQKYAFCFDKKSGALLNRAWPEVRPRNTVNVSCLYAIFRKFGESWVPREMACFEDKHRLIDAKVEELSVEASPDPLLFTPPRGAIELCLGVTAPAERVFNSEQGYRYPTGPLGRTVRWAYLLLWTRTGSQKTLR